MNLLSTIKQANNNQVNSDSTTDVFGYWICIENT